MSYARSPVPMLSDGQEVVIETAGQHWVISWHSPPNAPEGRPHGSAGLCVTGDDLVLVTADGETWDFPADRPEGDESWEDTLRREIMEEACVAVTEARFLGFTRGRCVAKDDALSRVQQNYVPAWARAVHEAN